MALDQYGNIIPDPNSDVGGFELGELDTQSDLIQQQTSNPNIEAVLKQLGLGFDPQTGQLIQLGVGQYEQAIQDQRDFLDSPDAFSDADLDQFHKLISGEFFTSDMAGTFQDRIHRMNKGYRDEASASLSARGLGTSGGEQAALMGDIQKGEQSSFNEIAAQQFLNAIGMGTSGLGSAATAATNKAATGANMGQAAFGMGSNVRNFIEGSQQNRMGIGLQAAGMQQQGAANVLGASTDWRQYQQARGSGLENFMGQALPMAANYFMPGAGAATNMFGEFGGNVTDQFNNSSNALGGG